MKKSEMVWKNIAAAILVVVAFLVAGLLSCRVMLLEDVRQYQKGPQN